MPDPLPIPWRLHLPEINTVQHQNWYKCRVLILCFKLVILDAKSNSVVQSLPLQRDEQEADVYDLQPGNTYLACLQLHVRSSVIMFSVVAIFTLIS